MKTQHLHHAVVKTEHLHHTVVKTQHLHHAVVKIQINMTFTPCHGGNSDLHDIFTTLWWKFRFTRHFHHAMVKIQIYMTFNHTVVKIQIFTTFSQCCGEYADFHNIYITPWWKFRFTQHFHYTCWNFPDKIYTTCSEN